MSAPTEMPILAPSLPNKDVPLMDVGSGHLVRLLVKTGGWRTRAQIGTLLEDARDCFGAADACWDRKDWPEMLRHIADGITAADKLRRITK